MNSEKHWYEEFQEQDFITRWLHNSRYSNLKKIVKKTCKELNKSINIIDIGCGPSKAFQVISELNIEFKYIGIEIRKDFYQLSLERYGENDNFSIINDNVENCFDEFIKADLIIGLESFEHIKEGIVFKMLEAISKSSFKYLYVTVPNELGIALLIKNIGSYIMGYQRSKDYSLIETIYATTYNLDKIKRVYDDHKCFDWRWLAHSLRLNVDIIEKTTSPSNLIPTFISPSIGFICKKKDN